MRKILIIFGIIIAVCLVVFVLLARRGVFLIPTFLIPKTTQKVFSGEDCGSFDVLFKRNFCYKSAAFKQRDHTLCERIIISEEAETSRQNKALCYKDIARITNNRTLCDKAGQFKSECLIEIK